MLSSKRIHNVTIFLQVRTCSGKPVAGPGQIYIKGGRKGQNGNCTKRDPGNHQPQPVTRLRTDRGALGSTAASRLYPPPASGWGFWALCPTHRHGRRPPSLLPTDSVRPPILLLLRRRPPLILCHLSTRLRGYAFEAPILSQVRNEPLIPYKRDYAPSFLSEETAMNILVRIII